jgi:hypothetical protein
MQHYLKTSEFLKKFSTTCFDLCGHHKELQLLWCRICCAHLALFLVRSHASAGVSLGDGQLFLCVTTTMTLNLKINIEIILLWHILGSLRCHSDKMKKGVTGETTCVTDTDGIRLQTSGLKTLIKSQLRDKELYERIILKRILKEQDVRLWPAFVQLRTLYTGGLLRTDSEP